MKFDFSDFPVLDTERLQLRSLQKSDAGTILFLRSDPTVNHYIVRKSPKNIKDAEDFIKEIDDKLINCKIIYWAICLRKSEEMIGTICLWNFSINKAEIGYELKPTYQNQGIMSEALKAVLQYSFLDLQFDQVEAYTHKENQASQSLLRKHDFSWLKGKKDEHNSHNLIFILRKSTWLTY